VPARSVRELVRRDEPDLAPGHVATEQRVPEHDLVGRAVADGLGVDPARPVGHVLHGHVHVPDTETCPELADLRGERTVAERLEPRLQDERLEQDRGAAEHG
jgi:hypothetical protein